MENNIELAELMRFENEEQFTTLVRMHLSFELDLNTDDSNEVALSEKLKIKKRFNFNKKPKNSCTSVKSDSPPSNSQILTERGIEQFRKLKEFLLQDQSIIQEGIFRRTGSVARQNELKSRIFDGIPLNLTNGKNTVHDCASVLKGMLADLPEPLLTDLYYPAHNQVAELCNNIDNTTVDVKEIRLLHTIQLLLLLLPQPNRILLKEVIEMLHKTIEYEKWNKMSADSLATLFTPHLICPKKLTPEALHQISQTMSSVISFMIVKGPAIFHIPPKLATDIRAYFVEQKRKRTMSPEHILNESIASDSVANTVYTFVDREKTAEAHITNPTDTALAQLYAHIQSLPESSKKRKLIKQFNKENGQGTPLQMQIMHRLKNNSSSSNLATKSGRSFSDSIKRHIFQKNLISRTPKTPTTTTQLTNTPSRKHSGNTTKSRLLFQSPLYTATSSTSTSTNAVSTTPKLSRPLIHTPSPMRRSVSTTILNETQTVFIEPIQVESISTPVSRTCSVEFDTNPDVSITINDIVEKIPIEKKKINFDVSIKDDDIDDDDETLTIATCNNISDIKSRYKSEPNLSRILTDHNICSTPIHNLNSNRMPLNLCNKLIKGVSMDNIKWLTPSGVGESSALSSPSVKILPVKSNESNFSSKETSILDDPDFEATPNSESSFDCQIDEIYTPIELVGIGRESMSPIRQATQRMSRAMQESIMTPRSRKPVMLMGTMLSSSDNQTTYQNSFSSLREEDEENENAPEVADDKLPAIENNTNEMNEKSEPSSPSLSNKFRQYLSSRSVVSMEPEDSSFSSHSDDFGSTNDLEQLTETDMSDSLLYCMNGNRPPGLSSPEMNAIQSDIQSTIFSKKRCNEFDDDHHKNEYGDGSSKKCANKIMKFCNDDDDDEDREPGQTSL